MSMKGPAAPLPNALTTSPACRTCTSRGRPLGNGVTTVSAYSRCMVRAMCSDLDSVPPIPVISGAAVSHEDLVLEARDGNRSAAFLATPDEPAASGVVILPDVRGLYRFYEELALRFGERGYAAVAIDYFGRTAGVEKRGDDFESPPHVAQTTPEGIRADVAAAIAWLKERGCTSIFTVG